MHTTRHFILLIVIILLVATATRLYGIQTQSLWFDEGWSAYAATQPTVIDAANADATNPPLYYVLLHISTGFLGASEFSLRLFSLWMGLLVIALSYQLGKRLFSPRAGIYAALMTAASPLLWWASQEARMYTLLTALVLLCALAWHALYRHPSRAAWLALWLGELALLYAHNTGPIVLIWLNLVTLIAWVVHRRIDNPFNWKWWLGGQIAVAALWLPYFFSRFVAISEANSAVASAPRLTPQFGLNLWQALWQTPWERVRLSGESLLVYFVLLIGFLLLVPWRPAATRWLVLHALLLTGGVIAALIILGNEMHGRYLVMAAPLLLVALGAGIARLRPQILRLALTAGVVAIFVWNIVYAQDSDYRHDDARGMAQYYAAMLTADDTVLAWSYADRYELAYYWNREGVEARRVTLPEGADFDRVLPLLPQSGDVALNIWYTQRADYRGMMPCLLGNGTVNEPEQHTVYGMSNLLYRSPTLNLPSLEAAALTFGDSRDPIVTVMRSGRITAATPDRAQCVPIEITLLRDVDVELKAALIVQNALGWEIARADAVFATPDQRTSDNVSPGTTLTAYPLLRLPYGAPPGEYRVFLRIYDELSMASGYAPPAGVTVSGRDALLGVWQAPVGAAWESVNQEPNLPNEVNIPVDDGLILVALDALPDAAPVVVNGGEIRLTLLWQGIDPLPTLTLADMEGQWHVDVSASSGEHDTITRDWRSVRIPADAPSGTAELRLPDRTVLARYTVESLPLVLDVPAFEQETNVHFPGLGDLVGFSLSDPITLSEAPTLTLVWRAGEPSAESYTVFAQFLNAEGQVIAQSDVIPAGSTRPTTGWRAGEYVEDTHTLQYNDLAAPGEVRLIVGLYNAATGQRLMLADGTDFAVLTEDLEVR